MADTGYRPQQPSWIRQLLTKILLYLRRIGLSHHELTDQDILNIIAIASRESRKRKRGKGASGTDFNGQVQTGTDGTRFAVEKTPYYLVPWKEGLHRAVTDKNVRKPVFVSETPEIFREIGFTSLPMLMNVRHLRLNYYNKADFEKLFGTMRQGEHAHNLQDKMISLPNALKHPLAIVVNLAPNATPGSVVAITDMNVNGKKVVVPILIESIKTVDNADIDSHLVLTVYDSNDWMEQFLKPAIRAEKKGVGIFYFDENKASKYTAYSNKIGNIPTGSVHNIAEAGLNVKSQTETLQFKRWFGNSKVVDQNGEPLVVYPCQFRI